MIPRKEDHLDSAAITDPGSRGRLNEDCYQITSFTISEKDDTPVLLTIVADGIGGHKAGEIASKIAVETIISSVADSDVSDPLWVLKSALLEANHRITSEGTENDTQSGMGSTVACALVIDTALYVATMGDSRIYLIRDNNIRQLTVDHTWVQEALDVGVINSDEARSHPRRHLIRSYLGSSDPIQPDLRLYMADNENMEQAKANQGLPLLPNDCVLLCSDGLTDLVADEEILDILQGEDSREDQLQKMVDLANLRGGHDNITIALVQPPGDDLFPDEEPES